MTKEHITAIKKRLTTLSLMKEMQCKVYAECEYDPYMHGLANGLLMAEAIMKGEDDVVLLEAFNTQDKLKDRAKAVLSRPEKIPKYDH